MTKRIIMAIAIIASIAFADNTADQTGFPANVCCAHAPNDGTFTRTAYSVNIYTESGLYKGSFAVYFHHGQKYIDFHNTWICIQGRTRFGYCGNWYVIR